MALGRVLVLWLFLAFLLNVSHSVPNGVIFFLGRLVVASCGVLIKALAVGPLISKVSLLSLLKLGFPMRLKLSLGLGRSRFGSWPWLWILSNL